MRSRHFCRAGGLVLLALVLVLGADALWILVDDAFIAFRHVSNARDGHGLVWNAPPFLPVEGYTSFLWCLVLWAVWSGLGIEPPDAANVLSIACGLGSLAVVAGVLFRLRDRGGARVHDAVVFAALAAVATNRTFLQWLTSGLETALFNLGTLGWLVLAFRAPQRRTARWLAAWAATAALVALTRPDGLLLVAATLAVALAAACGGERSWRATAAALAPLLAVALHVAWRRAFYGEWLPNTYHAKVGAPWPEAGARYLACFAVEHGVWAWLLLAAAWLANELRRGRAAVREAVRLHLPALAAVGAVVFHVGWYTLRVGGDHFEYRMVSHLIAPFALSAAAMAVRLRAGARFATGCVLAFGVAASASWVPHALTAFHVPPRYDPVSDHVPAWARPVARWYDRQRLWLQAHFVCMRFRHGIRGDAVLADVPPRVRLPFDPRDVPVAKFSAVGRLGWVLPDVAVIDELGLNDWVVARHKPSSWRASPAPIVAAALAVADTDADGTCTRGELQAAFRAVPQHSVADADAFVELLLLLFGRAAEDRLTRAEAAATVPFFGELRLMVHECAPPPGYVEAFAPNVTVVGREVVVRPRATPLSADDVRALEAQWRQRVREGR
jgi:arabinofuranosyltransferase